MADTAVKIPFSEAAAPSTPAANKVVIYAKSDGLMYSKDDAGAETLMSSGGAGSVATDPIWDAAGDLVVGTGANTAARLAIGNAGANLARINGAVAWDASTSFPTAATNDRFHRTDHDLTFYYDGTRWLSTTLYSLTSNVGNVSTAPTSIGNRIHAPSILGLDLWLVALDVSVGVFGTNDGSNYWTYTLDKRASNDGATTIATKTTQAISASTWTRHTDAIGASLAVGTHFNFVWTASVKTGSPANLQGTFSLTYRLIGT